MRSIRWLIWFLRMSGKHNLSGDALASIFAQEITDQERRAFLDRIFSKKGGTEEFLALADLRRRDVVLRQELNAMNMESTAAASLKLFAKDEIRAARKRIRMSGSSHKARFPLFATAFATILAIIFAVVFIQKPASVVDLYRDSFPVTIEARSPRGEIPRSAIKFHWSQVRGAKHYTLEIMDNKLTLLYRKDMIERESFSLPLNVRDKLNSGQLYFWKVTAEMGEDGQLESVFEKFRITGT